MNNRRTFFIALIFLAIISACVIPATQTPSAPSLSPIVDTGQLETMVAATVSAAIAQTEQAQPTLTSTSTTAPTVAPTLSPTISPTASLIPASEIVSAGSTLTVQVDASTIFADNFAGYEITVPAGWLIMRVNEQEYLDALQLAEAADENIQKSMLSIQNEDADILRLFAIDAQEGHLQDGFVTTLKFVLDEKKPISLADDKELKASAAQMAATVPGLEVLSTKLSMINEIPMGLIESKYVIKNSSNADMIVFQKQAVFNSAAGKMTITLSTTTGLQETLAPVFNAMLATIKIGTK